MRQAMQFKYKLNALQLFLIQTIIGIVLGLLLCKVVFAECSVEGVNEVAAGGIQFIKNPAIKILNEELTITPQEIKVNYLFKNTSDKAITTTIYFLLPHPEWRSMGSETWDEEISNIEKINEQPFRDFSVEVDGKLVNSKIKSRAVLDDGIDITETLIKAHIPLNPDLVADEVYAEYESLGETYYAELKKWNDKAKQLGLLDAQGKPKWKKQILFSWEQTFPANKTIAVSQRYSPATGFDCDGTTDTDPRVVKYVLSNLKQDRNGKDISNFGNFDDYMSWVKKQIRKGTYARYQVKYILTTGNSPIEKFTLNLPYLNGTDSTIVYNQFYKNNSVKIVKTPEKIQISLNNFVPTEDLNVHFCTTKMLESIK